MNDIYDDMLYEYALRLMWRELDELLNNPKEN